MSRINKKNILSFISPKNWTSLGSDSQENYISQRTNILLSQIAIFSIIISLLRFTIEFILKTYWTAIIDLLITTACIFVYRLNERGKHKEASFLIASSFNLLFFIYCNLVPKETGSYLIFTTFIFGSILTFGREQKELYMGFSFLSIFLIILLYIVDFNLFDFNDFKGDVDSLFLINMCNISVAIYFGGKFLMDVNHSSEIKLLANEKRLKKMAKDLNKKNKSLKKANTELDRFVYSTSHDLRAPLKSVLGLINLAKLDLPAVKESEYFNMMTQRIHNLEEFIQKITDYSRNARLAIENEQVDIHWLFNEIIENLRYMEEAEGVALNTSFDLKAPVVADKSRLFMLLNNLVTNAIKYHDKEKENRFIELIATSRDDIFTIAIRDNGLGIKSQNQKKVFDMFFKEDQFKNNSSSGLGLYIVNELVENMKGKIKLSSEYLVGTTFTIILPNHKFVKTT